MPRVYCYAEKKELCRTQRTDGSFNFHFDGASKEAKDLELELAGVLNGIHDAVYSFREIHSQTQSNPLRVFIPHYDAVLNSISEGGGGSVGLLGAQLMLRLKHLMQHDSFPGSTVGISTDTNTAPSTVEQSLPSLANKAHIRMTVLVSVLPSAIPSSLSPSPSCLLQTLNSLADTVLGVESFAGHADAVPIEFRSVTLHSSSQ